jgi:hypothetical protein
MVIAIKVLLVNSSNLKIGRQGDEEHGIKNTLSKKEFSKDRPVISTSLVN